MRELAVVDWPGVLPADAIAADSKCETWARSPFELKDVAGAEAPFCIPACWECRDTTTSRSPKRSRCGRLFCGIIVKRFA
jgi:hypothetical protein